MALSNKDEAEVKAIRDMLDEGDNQLNELLGQIPSSYVYVLDGEGRLLYVNPKFAKAMSAADGSELIGTVYYDLLDTATAEAQRASNQKVLDTQESALNTQDTFARKGGRIDAVCTQKSYTLVLDNPAVITISAMIDKMAMAKGGMKWSVDDASAKTESQPATETATTKEPETADETATAKETAEDAAKEAEPASEERSEEPDNKRSKPNTEVDEHTATTE